MRLTGFGVTTSGGMGPACAKIHTQMGYFRLLLPGIR
jgi:hypothetical protein